MNKSAHEAEQKRGAVKIQARSSSASSARKEPRAVPASLGKSASEKLSGEISCERSSNVGVAYRDNLIQGSPHDRSVAELPGTPTWGDRTWHDADPRSSPQAVSSIQSSGSSPSNSRSFGVAPDSKDFRDICMDPQSIQRSSILFCISQDEGLGVDIWESMSSHVPIGKVHYGETVIARGPAQEVIAGCYLVPISPSGVVELEFFSLQEPPTDRSTNGLRHNAGGAMLGHCPSSSSSSAIRRSFESSDSVTYSGRVGESKAFQREKARRMLAKELFRNVATPSSKDGSEVPSSVQSGSSKSDSVGKLRGGMQKPSSDEGQRFGLEIVASEKDTYLGMEHRWSIRDVPRVFVEHVQPNSWASKKQLTPGIEITSINGTYVAAMQQQTFLNELEKRPLCLVVRSLENSPADSIDGKQGIDISDGPVAQDAPEEEPSPNLPPEPLQDETPVKAVRPIIRQATDRAMGSPFHSISFNSQVRRLDRGAVHAGTILTCVYKGNYGAADVWENVRTPRIINVIYDGNCVMAAGAPVEIRNDFFLIPILPNGAVEADCFEPIEIIAGTHLICTSEEAEVWANSGSAEIIGVLQKGIAVKAKAAPSLEADMVMVPIEPRGAIDLDHFGLLQADRNNVEHGNQPVQLGGVIAQEETWVDPGMNSICSGETILCRAEEGANIHASCASADIIGSILFREHVIARGRPLEVQGATWIPVQPDGYVDLKLFSLASRQDAKKFGMERPPSPNSNRILLGLSRWASGICGPLENALEYILEKRESLEQHISAATDVDTQNAGGLGEYISKLREATGAQSFGRNLACSWMMQNDTAFREMLLSIPNLDIPLLRVFLTYFEWALRLRPDVTVDFILQTWATFSSASTSKRYTAQQDQSLLLDLLGMRTVGEPVDETTMKNLGEMMKHLEEMLQEDEDAARRRLVSELVSRLEAFYGSVEDGIRAMVGPDCSGITMDDFSAHLGFLRVRNQSEYDPLAAELFEVIDMDGDGLISLTDWVEAFELMKDPDNPGIEIVKRHVKHFVKHRGKDESSSDEEYQKEKKHMLEEKRRKSEQKHKDAVLHALGFDSSSEEEDPEKVMDKKTGKGKGKKKKAQVKRMPMKRPSLLAWVISEKERKERANTERPTLRDDRSKVHETTTRSSIEREEPSSSDEEYSGRYEPAVLHQRIIDKLIAADIGKERLDTVSQEEKRLAEHRAEREVSINGKWTHDKHVMVITGVTAIFENGETCEIHCIGNRKYQCIFNGLTLAGKLMEDHRRVIWRHEHHNMVWYRDLCEGSLKKVRWYMGMRIMDPHPELFFKRIDKVGSGILTGDRVRKIIRDDLRISLKELSDEDVDAFIRPLDCGGVSIHDLVQFMEIGVAAITSLEAEKAYSDQTKKTEERLKAWKREHDDGVDPKLKRIGLNEASCRLLQARLKAAIFGTKPEELVKRYDQHKVGHVDIDEFVHFIRATLKIPSSDMSDKSIVRLYVALDTDGNHKLDLKEFALLVEFGVDYILAESPEAVEKLKSRAKAKATIQKDRLDRAVAASEKRRHSRNLLQELSQADVSGFLQAKQQLKKGDSNVRIYNLLSHDVSHQGYPSAAKKDLKPHNEIKQFVDEHGLDLPRGALDRLIIALDPSETGTIDIRHLAEFLEHPSKTPAKMLAARGIPFSRGKAQIARNPFDGNCGVARFRKLLLDKAQNSSADVDSFLKQYDNGTGFLDIRQVRALMDSLAKSMNASSQSSRISKSNVMQLVIAIGGSRGGIRLDDLGAFLKTPVFMTMAERKTGQLPTTQDNDDFRRWRPPAAPLSDNPWLPRTTASAAVEASMRMEAAKAASPPPNSKASINVNIKNKRSFSEPRRVQPNDRSRSPQTTFNYAGINPVRQRKAPTVSPRSMLMKQKPNPEDWHERLHKGTTDSWDCRFVPGFQPVEKVRKQVNPMARQTIASRPKESSSAEPFVPRSHVAPQLQEKPVEGHVPGSRAARLQARQQQQQEQHEQQQKLQRERDQNTAATTIQTQWRASRTQAAPQPASVKEKKSDAASIGATQQASVSMRRSHNQEKVQRKKAPPASRDAAASTIQRQWRSKNTTSKDSGGPRNRKNQELGPLQFGDLMDDAQKVADMRKDLVDRRGNIERLQAEVETRRVLAMIEAEKVQLQKKIANGEKVEVELNTHKQESIKLQTAGIENAEAAQPNNTVFSWFSNFGFDEADMPQEEPQSIQKSTESSAIDEVARSQKYSAVSMSPEKHSSVVEDSFGPNKSEAPPASATNQQNTVQDAAAQKIQSSWRKHLTRVKAVATTKRITRLAKRQTRAAGAATFQSGVVPKRRSDPQNEPRDVESIVSDKVEDQKQVEEADDYGLRALGLGTMFANALSAVAQDGDTEPVEKKKKRKKKTSDAEGGGER